MSSVSLFQSPLGEVVDCNLITSDAVLWLGRFQSPLGEVVDCNFSRPSSDGLQQRVSIPVRGSG